MRTWLCGTLMTLVSLLPAAAAGEEFLIPLLREQDEGIDLRVLRSEAGYFFDVAMTETGDEELSLRFFSGDSDITETAQAGPPAAAIAYILGGSDEALQCRAKWRMDTILGQNPTASLGFTQSPNSLCPELGIVGTTAAWPQRFRGEAGYRRLLVILMDDAGEGRFFDHGGPLVWDRLALAYALQEDTPTLAQRLNDFVLPNLSGMLVFLPYPGGDRNAAVRAVTFKNGTEVFEVSIVDSAEPLGFETQQTAVIVAVIAGILLLGVLVLLATRKAGSFPPDATKEDPPRDDQPLRAVTIGYGAGFDYSLGPGDAAAVARIELYRDGRRKLVRLNPATRIEVDGSDIRNQSWIDEASAIRIAQRKIVVS